MKPEAFFDHPPLQYSLSVLFNKNKKKVYSSQEVFEALQKVGVDSSRNTVTAALQEFPAVKVCDGFKIYGHKYAVNYYEAHPKELEKYLPDTTWVVKLLQKHSKEIYQVKDVMKNVRKEYNINISIGTTRTALSKFSSISLVKRGGHGYYGTEHALQGFKAMLNKKGTKYYYFERGGGKK